jgi:Na+/H+-dicarboxylate symporter
MFSHVHFAAIAAWLLFATVGLLWIMLCALTASRMEKEGVGLWKGFLVCIFLTPLAGLIAIFLVRILRPGRPLAHTVSRG